MSSLKKATALQPDNSRYGYVYGIALHSVGDTEKAITALEENHKRHPNDRQTLFTLITMHRDQGNIKTAGRYAEKLSALAPEDQNARQLLKQLTTKP
jgi:predicted Zn-dependent protease